MQPVYLHIIDAAPERNNLRFRIQSMMARYPYETGIAMTMEIIYGEPNIRRVAYAVRHGGRDQKSTIHQLAFWNLDLPSLINSGFGDWRMTREARLLMELKHFVNPNANIGLIDCLDPTKYNQTQKQQFLDWLRNSWSVNSVVEGQPVGFAAVT